MNKLDRFIQKNKQLVLPIIKMCNQRQKYREDKNGVSWYASCSINSYCDKCKKEIEDLKKKLEGEINEEEHSK